jgi:hypothetical protein
MVAIVHNAHIAPIDHVRGITIRMEIINRVLMVIVLLMVTALSVRATTIIMVIALNVPDIIIVVKEAFSPVHTIMNVVKEVVINHVLTVTARLMAIVLNVPVSIRMAVEDLVMIVRSVAQVTMIRMLNTAERNRSNIGSNLSIRMTRSV